MAENTLSKLALNNKIVEMRKSVRQARIHCISKLCKEIRKLKDKKGPEQLLSKNRRKTEKLLEQLSVMKKVKPDVVSKFALRNEKSMIEITNDVSESMENKALARLGNHKSIQEKILEFRKTFPDWRKSLESLLETLGEKYKNKKPSKPLTNRKASKSNQEGNSAALLSKCTKKNGKTSCLSQIAPVSNSSGQWTVENFENGDTNIEMKGCDNLLDNSTDDHKILEEKLSPVDSKSVKKTSSVKPFKSKRVLKLEENLATTSNESNMNCDEDFPEITADPFFLTEDNKEYLSISAKQIASEEGIHSNQDEKYGKYQQKPKKFNGKNKSFNLKFKQNCGSFQQSDSKKYKSSNLTKLNINNTNDKTIMNSLHPSWEAKKKLSNIIQSSQFQGKKTKFDD